MKSSFSRRPAVKKSVLLARSLVLGLILAFCISPATPQARNNYPKPPEPQNSETTNPSPNNPPRRIDEAQLQRDADELARTAQSIPTDVASVRKGMLPKDVIDKLKQIEKLSKRLRTELNP
jgi:hypothetical protein